VSAEDFHGTEYQRRVVDLRNGPYLDFPAVLSIETYTLCNAACDFCPYPGLERKGERMSDQLIEKILGDIEEIENRPPFEINLSRVNEPFLDTRILDLSVEIERRFPEATHMFFSNGTPLVEKTLLGLARLKKVGFLVVSLNDHRADHYERIMRLPFENTLRRLDLIEEMKAAGAFGFPIYVCRVGDGTAVDAEFLQFVKARYPSLSALVTVRGDWMGVVPSPAVGVVPDVGCRQWFQLHFLSNGKCAFCCIDSDGRHGIGDVRTAHAIRDIYNHPLKRAFRMEAPSRLSVEQCSGCSMLP
jgi:hypothetical protein